ncbi:DUF481 domain-containing protein [Coraliomargarita akajimensis]|uniref:DUF481 domain-containing protein n=1 Tax=Coraliomargarita akajimensis (strain DSM 45221 / IAM 15411 / JCM 23193 / KCTC 12865 / 04OKA010-24) TaxID=583355 RepID=D5EHQ7_CORAD|nr:DUF481 domain-containing protein [Coraliomargarita akajimensis]ADE54098.1 protein of unknown function DUF481 [Coraliomargarita akajimensis DSM 45221]
MIQKLILAASVASLSTLSLLGDTVITKDGSTLNGTITLIDKGEIHIETKYAGTVKLKQEEVSTFNTENPMIVRLESGTQMEGPIASGDEGTVELQSTDGKLETNTANIAATWAPDARDPEVVRNERKWLYEAALDLNGKQGNTEKFYLGASFEAKLKSPDDELRFHAMWEKGEENGNTTEDRARAGVGYERFTKQRLGWYVHSQIETDTISDISFRSTSGAGLSWRFINNDKQTLIGRLGAGYRYTEFESGAEKESSPTLESSLAHTYKFTDWAYMENLLYYSPAFEDFMNYTAVHDSSIRMPFGRSEKWAIRMGLRNEYESETNAQENLDTFYYTKLIYSWK